MTGTFGFGGRTVLSAVDACQDREAELIDRLVELVLALEPLELKQHDDADPPEPDPGQERGLASGEAGAPVPVPDSTRRMLTQMRAVLDREAARLGTDAAEGKAAVDQVALIARTLEKIDQMERLIAEDQVRAAARTLSADERAGMRETVRQLILAAAERLAEERVALRVDEPEGEPRVLGGEEYSGPADAGPPDPGSRPG